MNKTLLDKFRVLTRKQGFKTSSDAFVEAVGVIRDLIDYGCELELIALHAEFEQFAGGATNSSPSVEILRGLLSALVKDITPSSQTGNDSLAGLTTAHSHTPIQTLTIGGQSFKVCEGAPLKVSSGNRNKFSREYVGTVFTDRGKVVLTDQRIRYFLTINFGCGLQFVGLARQPADIENDGDLKYFAFTSFETTDENWAAMFTELQTIVNGDSPIELPPSFYKKLVKAGKIV